jgi:dTDP-4-amino-4,6-dideoxygalactose transaminase
MEGNMMLKEKTARSVPFFNYPRVFTSHEDEYAARMLDVCRRGAFILQRDLAEFERNLAAYVGVKHVIGMANATDALHLGLRAAGIGAGDEVIFCTHTMVATAAAIHFAGAVPVPVECGPDHLLDPAAAAAAITPRTRAIVPTQLNGRICDMTALQKLAEQYKLTIVEDAAQALGSKFRGKCAGTFGLVGAVSFYPAKTLGCFGDGGCAMTDDDEVCRKLLLLRDHGRDADGDVVLWGLNSRLDNLQAAILDANLKRYDAQIARRRDIARRYRARLGNLAEVRLPPGPDDDAEHFDIFQNYEIEAQRRDQLREHLKSRGVGTLVQWGGKAVHQFRKLGFTQSLPYTEELFTRLLMLPMNMSLGDDDVDYVCDCIQEFYAC